MTLGCSERVSRYPSAGSAGVVYLVIQAIDRTRFLARCDRVCRQILLILPVILVRDRGCLVFWSHIKDNFDSRMPNRVLRFFGGDGTFRVPTFLRD